MLIRSLLVTAAALCTAACATTQSAATDCGGTPCAALGEAFDAGAVTVTPLEVLEDSRCPVGAQCVWAGQVRLRALVDRDGREREVELTAAEPLPVYSGNLELTQVWPAAAPEAPIDGPQSYRFQFTWSPHMLDTVQ